jgi:hypothetical protein
MNASSGNPFGLDTSRPTYTEAQKRAMMAGINPFAQSQQPTGPTTPTDPSAPAPFSTPFLPFSGEAGAPVSPADWNGFRNHARASTQAINRMPFVLDPASLNGLNETQIRERMYPGAAPAPTTVPLDQSHDSAAMSEQLTLLRTLLGLPEDADPSQVTQSGLGRLLGLGSAPPPEMPIR